MSILTPQELARLRLVKATREQAEQILNRNTPMAQALDSLPPTLEEAQAKYGAKVVTLYTGTIGCPHCNNCQCDPDGYCEWGKYEGTLPCCIPTFGGVSLGDICRTTRQVVIVYHDSNELIKLRLLDYVDYKVDWEQSLKDAKNFVGGHIEWALDMLERLNK